jgi:hypothetical protein
MNLLLKFVRAEPLAVSGFVNSLLEKLRAKLLVIKTRVFVSRGLYFPAALDVESHSSFRGTKPSFCLAYALEAPRSRIA